MNRTMRALVKTGPRPGLELIEVPVPQVRPGEVLIRVRATGICGTDLHIAGWDDWAQAQIKPPLVVGHEFCGDIVAVGSGVDGLMDAERRTGRYGTRPDRPSV